MFYFVCHINECKDLEYFSIPISTGKQSIVGVMCSIMHFLKEKCLYI